MEIVVDFRYKSQWGECCPNGVNGSYGVGLCKFIWRGWEAFSSFTRFEVGEGSKISFWHDM